MKWKASNVGDTCNIRKFLWKPLTCDVAGTNTKETRWLCFVTIHQRWAYEWLNEWFVYVDES
jgi:hypothetical protein